MANVPEITRPAPGPVGRAAGLVGTRAAARRVDVTPEVGLGMAGHGPDTDRAHGAMGRLWANVLVIDDGKDERVALIAIDLMAGSRFLSERLAERVAGDTGLSVERIFLAGSHTHRAPGWVWGNGTYDRITATADPTTWDAHFDLELADALVGRLEGAVRAACRDLRLDGARAKVGYGTAPAWNAAWNRSLEASLTQPDGLHRDPDPAPGERWKRPAYDDSRTYVQALHATLNGGDVAPPTAGGPGPTREPSPGPGPAAGPAPDDVFTDDLAGDEPDGVALEDLNGSARFAMVRELLSGDDRADTPPSLKELRRRFADGDPTLTMDDILRVLLDPETSQLEIGTFLLHIRAWVDGNGRNWEHRKERWGERLVADARLHALAAFREADGEPIGAFCTFGATPSIVGAHAAVYCGDGFAAAAASWRQKRGKDVAIGIAGGTLGDTNLCDPGRPALDIKEHRKDLAELLEILDGAADALAVALDRALLDAGDRALTGVTLGVALAEDDPRAQTVRPAWLGKDKQLPEHAAFGFSTLAASDLGQSSARIILSEELFVDYDGDDPWPPTAEEHLPKPQLPRFAFDPRPLPVRVVTFEGRDAHGEVQRVALAGLPAEISTLLGHQAAERLANQLRARTFVAGPVGDYCSYFSTVWEYTAQHYEGASAPWGRWSGDWLVERLCRAAEQRPRPLPGSTARFSGAVGRPERGLRGVRKMGSKDRSVPKLGHAALEAVQGESSS